MTKTNNININNYVNTATKAKQKKKSSIPICNDPIKVEDIIITEHAPDMVMTKHMTENNKFLINLFVNSPVGTYNILDIKYRTNILTLSTKYFSGKYSCRQLKNGTQITWVKTEEL